MRDRRRARDLRGLHLALPDARSSAVRRRVAIQVAGRHRDSEDDASSLIEAVSEFDELDRSMKQ